MVALSMSAQLLTQTVPPEFRVTVGIISCPWVLLSVLIADEFSLIPQCCLERGSGWSKAALGGGVQVVPL